MSGFPDVESASCRILADDGTTAGTGFFFLPDGHLLTCHHVVFAQEQLRVLVPGESEPRPARYVESCSDPERDVAVLMVVGPPPACVQLGSLREGLALGFGFRPTEAATEPHGHAFSGRLARGQELRIAPDTAARDAIDRLSPERRSPWNVIPEAFRIGRVANFVESIGLQRGISGGPVYDPAVRRVVGMFRAVEGGELAYVIHADDLLVASPELLERNHAEVEDGPLDRLKLDYDIGLVGEGARAAPPRARRYFAELLDGASRVGGRAAELDRLAEHVENGAGTYVFVTGPAGFGKSALLARWVVELAQQQHPLAFHFVSRGELGSAVLESLCEQLLAVHGLGGRLPQQERDLRLLYADLLALPAPTERGLLVVLDGLDEALGTWDVRPDLFPDDLPAGTRIVFSAREIAGIAWPATVGLSLAKGETIELGRLDEGEIADVVARAGTVPADVAAAAAKIAAISNGDPFYVHDLVDELAGADGGLARLEGLSGTHSDYLRRWWKSGVEECGEDQFTDLMGTLALARGPLPRDDVVSVSADDSLRDTNIDLVVDRARRYLNGDARRGYWLSHSRIRDFVEALLGSDAAVYKRRLADYCLGSARSSYVLVNGAQHVAEVYGVDRLGELLDAEWIYANWQRFGSYASLIDSFGIALRTAAAEATPDAALVAALTVARQTARELMQAVPTSLLIGWIRTGQVERVISIARSLPAERGYAAEQLTAVARELLGDGADDATLGAAVELLSAAVGMLTLIRASGTQREQVDALCELLAGGRVPAQAAGRVFEQLERAVEAIEDSTTRAYALAVAGETAVALGVDPEPSVRQALDALGEIDHPPDRLIVEARLLPVLARTDPAEGRRRIDAALADASLLKASPLGESPAAVLARALRRLGETDALEVLGARVVEEARFDGTAAALVAVGLIEAGTDGESDLLDRALARLDEDPAEVTTAVFAVLERVDATRAQRWRDSLETVLGSLNPATFRPSFVVSAIAIGAIDLALALVERFPLSDLPFDEVVTALDELDAPDAAQARGLIERLRAGIEDSDEAPARWAAVGSVLLRYDADAGGELIERAARLCLGELPEGDTDDLRTIAAAACYSEGRVPDALEHVARMHWISSAAAALRRLIEDSAGANGALAERYVSAFRSLLAEGRGRLLYTNALAEATRTVSILAESHPDLGLSLCEAVRDAWQGDDVRDSYGFEQGIAALAESRVNIDGDTSLFFELLERAEQAPDDDLVERALAPLLESTARTPSLGDDHVTTIYTRAEAKAATLVGELGRANVDRELALVRARFDPEGAAAALERRVAELAAEIDSGAAESSPGLLAFYKLVGDLTGSRGSVAFEHVTAAERLAEAFVRLGGRAPDHAERLLHELIETVARIPTRLDAVNGLSAVVVACRSAPSELRPSLKAIISDVMNRAAALEAETSEELLVKILQTLLALNEHDLLRELLVPLFDEDAEEAAAIRNFLEAQIATRERNRTRSFVDRVCIEVAENPDLFEALDEGTPDVVLREACQQLAEEGNASRYQLLGGYACALAAVSLHATGVDSVGRMIAAIEDFESRFVAAAQRAAMAESA